jgi:hypothetical protein
MKASWRSLSGVIFVHFTLYRNRALARRQDNQAPGSAVPARSSMMAPNWVAKMGGRRFNAPVSMLERICEIAGARGLPVLFIGGHAVIAHGHPRNTFDVDLLISRDDRHSWSGLLERLGYTVLAQTSTFLQMQAPDEHTLPVDIMMVNEKTFTMMIASARWHEPLPLNARIVSLSHLLALKCHAIKHGHPGRVEKDVDDVVGLVAANRVEIKAPEWRELFLKYGPLELYEKLRRIQEKQSS